MESPGTVYFTGTAGAGKTSLVASFKSWLSSAGYDATVVNLDPGNDSPTLNPDIDIREWVRLDDVIEQYDLGPNGAQVAAADMIALKVLEVREALSELKSDYVLIDTPGQVELFAFRESSKAIVEALSGDRSVIAFLFDPALAKTPSGFVSLLMLSANVEFRFRLPTLNLLTKTDLLEPSVVEQILGWGEEPDRLEAAVELEIPTPDTQLSAGVFRVIEGMAPMMTLLATSSKDQTGHELLYRHLQQVFAGGEDLEPSHAPPEEE
jgi:hypothetical protein